MAHMNFAQPIDLGKYLEGHAKHINDVQWQDGRIGTIEWVDTAYTNPVICLVVEWLYDVFGIHSRYAFAE